MLILYPLIAAGIAVVFAARLWRQYRARRRPHALAWTLSLGLFAAAAAAVAVGIGAGWAPWVFAVYWVAGALLNVPLLATGQLLLLDAKRAVLWWTVAGIAAAWAVAFTLMATFDGGVLARASAERTIPLGREVLGGQTAYALVRPFNYTFAIVVIGSVWSAVRFRRPAVALIALGVSVVAASSSAVRVGQGRVFSVLLAVGVAIMYAGFAASARPRRPVVTVFTRERCGLCRQAEAIVARVAGRRAQVEVVDIDTDPELVERYTVRVPVVAVDGVEIAEHQVDPGALRARLKEARRGR